MLRQILLNGLIESSLTALMALGFALIYTTTRIFHIAHGAAYVLGAYGCLFALTVLGIGVLPAALVGVLTAAAGGALIELTVYAPLARRQAGSLVGLLSSLGTYVVIVNVIAILFGAENQTLVAGQSTAVALPMGFVTTRMQLAQIAVSLAAATSLLAVVGYTAFGRTIRVVRDNPTLASVMGTNVWMIRAVVLGLGSAFGGLAAVLSALDVGTDPHAGLPALLIASVAMILGGSRSLAGPVAGAFAVGLSRSVIVWAISAQWADAIIFAMLIAALVVSPQGLMVRRGRLEEAAA